MNEQILKKFSIFKLFKERDVSISFESNIKVLVAENGYGKTTILNALYYVATGNLFGLKKIEFESIEIIFNDGEKFDIKHSDLKLLEGAKDKGFYEHLKIILNEKDADDLLSDFFQMPAKQFKACKSFKAAAKKSGFGESLLGSYLEKYIRTEDNAADQFKNNRVVSRIKAKMPKNILYLPTYRRVEIDLGIKNDDESEQTENIHFGMKDVQDLISLRTQEILSSSVEWFSKVNGQMLSQLAEGFSLDEELKERIKKPDAVKIVLDRIGTNIDEDTKQKIPLLIESGEIFEGHDPLIYFISNLVKVYAQQKDNDQALQRFTEVCNRYLGDKMIQYDEGKVSVKVVRRKNGREVDMEALSSGEKQIISLFAKLYLQKRTDYAIFFDEPELSLSLEWQKTLLPDIINSNKCSFLFSTTHSPFIFANEFSKHTVDLAVYIKEL
ncbi:AAA family ATPase [Pseudomonas syringae]|uniref:AAA family ATPase n=1 Tax=Pseudomonas syringae TaxID=317 RepID=UPI001C674DDC|nr:AAA family ATPase [Pseudomonas syringae]